VIRSPADGPLGVLGGTFDPVHFAHLRLAEEIAEAFALSRVLLIPAAVPPHRDEPGAAASHRLAMLRLAATGNPRFSVDDRELRRAGASYSVDTLHELRDEHGERPLCLLMGADAFVLLASWHRWTEILDLAHLVVARRPGYPLEQLAASLPAELKQQYQRRHTADREILGQAPAGRIFTHELTALDVSATALRRLIAGGGSLRYLLPDGVIAYIHEHGLYKERDAH
jgi:nicotinate-nucleotide adenylyltransferase